MPRRLIITGMSGLVAVAFFTASPAMAESLNNSAKRLPGIHLAHERDAVAGKVIDINGSVFTVDEVRNATSSTVFTINASNAKVYKDGATSTVSEIRSGDKVFVKGTINGTNVSATIIVNGSMGGVMARVKDKMNHGNGSSTAPKMIRENLIKKFLPLSASTTDPLRGNFTLGNVTAVNGTSFTLVDKGRRDIATTTYTVITDNSTAFKKAGQSASLTDVTVGQFVMVAGAKNSANDTITATSINVVTKMPERVGNRDSRQMVGASK